MHFGSSRKRNLERRVDKLKRKLLTSDKKYVIRDIVGKCEELIVLFVRVRLWQLKGGNLDAMSADELKELLRTHQVRFEINFQRSRLCISSLRCCIFLLQGGGRCDPKHVGHTTSTWRAVKFRLIPNSYLIEVKGWYFPAMQITWTQKQQARKYDECAHAS